MKKLILAVTLATTAAATLPANAEPRADKTLGKMHAQSTIKVGDQCFKPTDGRGFGYWDHCDSVYQFTVGRRAQTLFNQDRGSDGGGGDGGGGGGGGGNR